MLIIVNFCLDSEVRITITREQSLKLQKLLREKPAGKRTFTDLEIRRNASRLKISAVKIRYWLKQRNALASDASRPPASVRIITPTITSATEENALLNRSRCKLFNDLSFEKKVLLMRKTYGITKVTAGLTQELCRELQIPRDRIYYWLKHKVLRNSRMKKSLTAGELAILEKKFATEYDYLDEDSALLLADRFNVSTAAIKKAFNQRKPSSANQRPVIEVKKLQMQLPPAVTLTAVTPKPTSTPAPEPEPTPASAPKASGKPGKTRSRFKTVGQKNLLFDAFRQSPTLTKPETVTELVKKTRLTPLQVTKWLSVFRTKWSHNNEAGLKTALTRGLESNQLVTLEKAYREERFLTNANLQQISKQIGLNLRSVQSWFSSRRIYEIRSDDKDLINIGPKTAAARKESDQQQQPTQTAKPSIKIPQQQPSQQSEDEDSAAAFFQSLNTQKRARLKAACKNFNVSYKKLAASLGAPVDKVTHYIRAYRVRHSIFRVSKFTLPERTHKALLNHYLKYGKISSKTSVILAKRLKVRPEQIINWNKNHCKKIQSLEHVVESKKTSSSDTEHTAAAAVEPAPAPAQPTEAIEDQFATDDAAESYEREASLACAVPAPKCKWTSKKDYSRKGKRYYAAAAAKCVLFEEFKKSPQLASTMTKQLAKTVKLTPLQVRKWLYNFGKNISEQNKSEVIACLQTPAISTEARIVLQDEYRSRRFLEDSEMETLAAELGLVKRQVANWFINARYYEILAGECPGGNSGSASSAQSNTSKPVIVSTKSSFYQRLDSEKQARLNEELAVYPFDDAKLDDLASELEVPSNELKKWFDNATRSGKIARRSVQVAATPDTSLTDAFEALPDFTAKQLETLTNEFNVDPIISDERAATLAKRIKITKDRIKTWFLHQAQQLSLNQSSSDKRKQKKHKIPPIKICMPKDSNETPTVVSSPANDSRPKSYEFKVPMQQNKLFEEFKASSTLTSERLIKISEETNLSGKQISAWFHWMNSKLSSISRDSLLEENRNRYLTTQQITALEKQYAKNRYVNRSSRETLSLKLDAPKNIIKSWFANRRYFEILCRDKFEDGNYQQFSSYPNYYDDNNSNNDVPEQDPIATDETVIDYDWEEKESEPLDIIDTFDHEDQKIDIKRPLDIDPLSIDCGFDEEPMEDIKTDMPSYNFQLSPNNPFMDDLTSLPYKSRDRFFTPLGSDLEPLEEDIEKLFWFANKTPNRNNTDFAQNIDEAKNRILETEFGKNPWPELHRISELSAQLLVSEPKIHWWFIKKRCFLTKTILTLPAPQSKTKPKNVLIDLTDDDVESQPFKCGEFEFVTLNEGVAQIKVEQPTNDDDNLENDDPFESNVTNDERSSLNNEQPSSEGFDKSTDINNSVDGTDHGEKSTDVNNSVDDTDHGEKSTEINNSVDDTDHGEKSTEINNSVDSTDDSSRTTVPLSTSTSTSTVRKKKQKISLTSHQRAILMQEFKRNKVISSSQARMLATDLGLSVGRVEAWFNTMRKSAVQKKPNHSEVTVCVKSLSPELEEGLEKEFAKSVNLSAKRAKMIALKLSTKTKIVTNWFIERAKKKKNEQSSS